MIVKSLDVSLPRSWDTAGAALAACARALGDPRSVGELLVASGRAFRLWLDARVTPAGLHAGAWREELTVAVERLGFRWQLEASTNDEPLWDATRVRAFDLARDGIAAGRPSLCFGVHVGEFGLVRGVDGERLVVSGVLDEAGASSLLARDQHGEPSGIVFVLQLVERVILDDQRAARATLIAAARAYDPRGWAAWESALASGDLDPLGLGQTAARHAEARSLIADHLPAIAARAGIALGGALAGYCRSAAMLGEVARLVPSPPPPGFMLTSTLREELADLVRAAATAESLAAGAIAKALDEDDRRRRAAHVTLRSLDARTLADLFACTAEIPIAGLAAAAADCRAALAPTLGRALDGKLLYDGDTLIGHILWAPLAEARYPIAAEGKRWLVYCPWVALGRRGAGLGQRLIEALVDEARASGIEGLLTLATSVDVFLARESWAALGFVEIDRAEGTLLMERSLGDSPSSARLVPPPSPARSPGAKLPVMVRHAHNCPLLLHVRRQVADVARAAGSALDVDEREASSVEPAGVIIGGRALPHGPIAPDAIAAGIADLARQQ